MLILFALDTDNFKPIVDQKNWDLLMLKLEGLPSHRLSNCQPVEISGGPARYERALMQDTHTCSRRHVQYWRSSKIR